MSSRRALICEDDPSIRSLVTTVVTREGFEVDVAENGRTGIERMESDCYELVILDLMMPEVDGYAVIDYLKTKRPANLKRVIIMTAASGVSRTDFPESICTVITKPFDIDRLAATVRDCARACGN
jgi:DNA-binding response OmpR family regulator